jgi:TonB-linked SusC/RagA family outer membrane protein
MMKKRFYLLFVFALMAFTAIHSQERMVSGTVTDANDGSVIPGANIIIQGETRGTITDIEGNYQLEVNSDDVLVFSFIGYKTLEIPVGDQRTLDVQMEPDFQLMDEVVVVGYGTMKRSDLTGSVTSVNQEDLQASVSTSIDQALQGRAAGVQVTKTSGQPGGGVSVRIRGASSIGGTNEPLYVIDGIPVSGDATGLNMGFAWAGGGSGQSTANVLSTINPNDIVSVEILKDASATAIYGSRAANGVVLISTRRGEAGKAKVEYNGYVGLQEMPKTIDVLNLREYAEYNNELSYENNLSPNPLFADPSILGDGTNWQEEIFDLALMHNHDLSVSGGNDKSTYAMSIGYMDQEGIVIGSGFDRLSTRINAESKSFDWLTIGGNMSLGQTNETVTLNDDDRGVVSLALIQRPEVPVKLPDGSWGGPQEGQAALTNPVAMAQIRDNNLKRIRFMSNVHADVTLMDGLVFKTQFGSDMSFVNNYGFNPTYEFGTIVNELNQSRRNFANNKSWIFSNFLTYNKDFVNGNIQTQTMLGAESQESNWEGLMGMRSNFISNDIQELNAGDASTASNGQYKGSNALESYFGRLNITLFDRFLLTGTFRADGSSNFAPTNKWGYFPSMALAWKISNESFIKNVDAISSLRLRLGYGEVGNQDIGGYTYGAALTNYKTKWGPGLLPSRYANPDVKWETTASYNLGLDLSMFNNRIELIGDVYLKQTNDLLMPLTLPLYMGTSSISAPTANVGAMENKGLELTLNTVNTVGAFKWTTGLTFTLNRNELTELYEKGNVIDRNVQWFDHATRSVVGRPLGQFYGYVADGVFADAEEIRNHASQGSIGKNNGVWPGDLKFKDLNNDDVIDENDRTFIGNPEPDFTLGLNNNFKFKNFDLTLYLLSSFGNDVLNYTRTMTEAMGNYFNQSKVVNDRARLGLLDPDGSNTDVDNVYVINPNTTVPRATHVDPNDNSRISTRFIEDGSYVKIKNLSLGYTMPQSVLSVLNVSNLRFYVNIQNLYTFTDYSGFDPEVGPYNQDPLLNGIDNGNYPSPRIYTFGVNVGF